MTKGCAAVTKAKQIAVVAERKLVRVLSGSRCVVIRSGQVGTDHCGARPAVSLLALLGAALEGPSPACWIAVTIGVELSGRTYSSPPATVGSWRRGLVVRVSSGRRPEPV